MKAARLHQTDVEHCPWHARLALPTFVLLLSDFRFSCMMHCAYERSTPSPQADRHHPGFTHEDSKLVSESVA